MSYQSAQGMMADPDYPGPQGAFPVWSKVFTKPGEQTFLSIIDHPEAKAKAAYIWVFIAGTLTGLISSLLQFVIAFAGLRDAAAQYGGLPEIYRLVGVGGLFFAICSAPLAGVSALIGFALSVAIVHATARFFGGQGNYDKLAYAFGAVAAPISIVSALVMPLSAFRITVFCTAPLMLGLGVYALYLQTAAIKAVHKLGWGESLGALLLPSILLFLLCGVILLGIMQLAGLSLGDLLQQGMP